MSDLKTALNRGKKLAEHRNIVAHNMPTISLHGAGTELAPRAMTAGVRLPTSKRKLLPTPATTAEELTKLQKSWMYQLDDIRRYTKDAIALQLSMAGINERMDKHRRGITGANI